ncbi:unnamed protein product [Prorocentrum cordatum]|uniref:Uncharacterized protein n=1 Tax=Prorocentrum cordatum TaxID=2364126 RepID=A0ABN9Q4K8_9DINO|nr:unnamed protein product [Polarella glacialis]
MQRQLQLIWTPHSLARGARQGRRRRRRREAPAPLQEICAELNFLTYSCAGLSPSRGRMWEEEGRGAGRRGGKGKKREGPTEAEAPTISREDSALLDTPRQDLTKLNLGTPRQEGASSTAFRQTSANGRRLPMSTWRARASNPSAQDEQHRELYSILPKWEHNCWRTGQKTIS